MNRILEERGFALLSDLQATDDQLTSYEDCPHDEYMGNGTRYKRFSQYSLVSDDGKWHIELLPARPYTALKQFNAIGGGFRRPYEPIKTDFTDLIAHLAAELDLDVSSRWQINVHQNRSVAEIGRKGHLTPEGRHKDGHEFVSISVFARNGVVGGRSRVWRTETDTEPLWDGVMMPGETLLLNDRSVLHDVTDIEAASIETGSRDILIVAYSRWEDRWYGEDHDKLAVEQM